MHREFRKVHNWNVANTVTSMRMAASLFLLFLPLKSIWFLVIYTIAGLTDVLDGWLARKTGRASEFGARLDSISDLLFYSVLLARLFPILYQILPGEIWYAVSGIVLVRIAAYATAAIKYHRFASLHTWLNKLTGVAVFLLPYVFLLCQVLCIAGQYAFWRLLRQQRNWQSIFYGKIIYRKENHS